MVGWVRRARPNALDSYFCWAVTLHLRWNTWPHYQQTGCKFLWEMRFINLGGVTSHRFQVCGSPTLITGRDAAKHSRREGSKSQEFVEVQVSNLLSKLKTILSGGAFGPRPFSPSSPLCSFLLLAEKWAHHQDKRCRTSTRVYRSLNVRLRLVECNSEEVDLLILASQRIKGKCIR